VNVTPATFFMELRSGLRTRLLTLANCPGVNWEGVDYEPTVGVPFITEAMRPVSSVVTAPGVGGVIAHTLLATFTLHFPANAGTNAIEAMAGALMDLFRPGNSISYGSSNAVIQQTERAGATQEPDWINLSVVVTLVGHTAN
jgi:hypothetical protein